MHVINKQENTLLKNVNNSSLVGMDRPPNYKDVAQPVFPKYELFDSLISFTQSME